MPQHWRERRKWWQGWWWLWRWPFWQHRWLFWWWYAYKLPANFRRKCRRCWRETVAQSNTFSWKFPPEISQSTLDGRNGSSACSVIAVIFAHGVWHERLDLQRLRSLCPLWVKLLIASIRVGNQLYDRCRHSLPHRFLSAAEAASVAEQCVSVSVASALAVRVCDEHAPTTLQHQLSILCIGAHPTNAALFIVNEKTVLFLALESSSIVLVDTYRHGMHGAEILLGQVVIECQKLLDMSGHTFGNLSFITF